MSQRITIDLTKVVVDGSEDDEPLLWIEQGGNVVQFSQELAGKIWPLLQHFAATGTLPGPGEAGESTPTLPHVWDRDFVDDQGADLCQYCFVSKTEENAGQECPERRTEAL